MSRHPASTHGESVQSLRPQWECYLTKQTHGVRAKVTVGNCGNGESCKCKHDVLITSPPVSFTHFRHRTPWTTHAAEHTRVPAVWWQFIYDWRLLKLSATVQLKLFDAAKTRGAHTHTSWRHQAASVVWASPGVEGRDAWQINCWYRISHCALRLIRSSWVARRCSAADCCLPSIGHDY